MIFTISPNKPFIKQTGLGHVLNLGVIIFGSVFIKKKLTKPNFKKNTETSSNRPVSVRFFRTKTSSNRPVSVRFFRTKTSSK
jgi:hypothetical protein